MSNSVFDYAIGALIVFLIVANFLHPGGWVLTSLLILALIGLWAAGKFVPEYILTTNQGKNATKTRRRRQRRARGLNPLTWLSRRRGGRRRRQGGEQSRQQHQQQTQQPRSGGGGNSRE